MAMIRAQAAKGGYWSKREAAGVGVLKQHLADGRWEETTPLSPEVALARATLSSAYLRRASQLIEKVTTAEQRLDILLEILGPHFKSRLFDKELGTSVVEADELEGCLQPKLPDPELEMVDLPGRPGKLISVSLVTAEQYGVFMRQVGHRLRGSLRSTNSLHNSGPLLECLEPGDSMHDVDYDYDVFPFGRWLGMRVPTREENSNAEKKRVLEVSNHLNGEWVADDEEGRLEYYDITTHRNRYGKEERVRIYHHRRPFRVVDDGPTSKSARGVGRERLTSAAEAEDAINMREMIASMAAYQG
ncbi:hypothetical protein ACFL5U_03440 [Candidatus Margulisiibacteriota bacterium]